MGGHHERPRPGRFSRMVVAYPVAVMMASGGIAIVLAMLAFTAGESELGGSFTDSRFCSGTSFGSLGARDFQPIHPNS